MSIRRVAVEVWLPGDRDETRAGGLEYGPKSNPVVTVLQGWHDPPRSRRVDGTVDEAMDGFSPDRPAQTWTSFARPSVHGRMIDGAQFSLLSVVDRPGPAQMTQTRSHQRIVRGNWLIVGAHVLAIEDLMVTEISARHDCLVLAAPPQGLSWELHNERHEDGSGGSVGVHPPEPLVRSARRHSLAVGFDGNVNTKAKIENGRSTLSVGSAPYVLVKPRTPRPFLDLWADAVVPFGRLVELCSRRRGGWTSIEVAQADESVRLMLYSQWLVGAGEDSADRDPADSLLHLTDIPKWFNTAVRNWERLYTDYEAALAEGAVASDERYVDEKARRYAAAVEGLGDIFGGAAWMDKQGARAARSDLDKVLRALGASDVEAAVDAVVNVLRRKSARSKVLSTIDALEQASGISLTDARNGVPNLLMVRNSYSHTEMGHRHPSSSDTAEAAELGQQLFEAVLIQQLGLPRKRSLKMLKGLLSNKSA